MNVDMEKVNELTKFLFEVGNLKRVKRSGWWTINIKDPESVAEHSMRAGVIGFVLAKLEGCDVAKVSLMCLFNDLHESRLNDLHKVGHRYIDFRAAETKAHKEQTESLPKNIGDEIFSLHEEFQQQISKESIVARDADLLECAFQAKEYIDCGFKDANDWLINIRKHLVSKSAIVLLDDLEKTSSNSWWSGLKKTDR